MLSRVLRRRPRDLAGLAAWSAVQALPVMASGWVLAEAASMFLSGRTADGMAWLGVQGAAAAAGAFGTRRMYARLGALVEPLRDDLVARVVGGALSGASGSGAPGSGAPGSGAGTEAVARLTHQAEIVRDTFAGLLSVAATFVFTVVSTVAGLTTLIPGTVWYAVPPLIVSVLILRLLLRPFAARQRDSVIGEETVARLASAAVSGLRDVTACGAEVRVLAGLDSAVRSQAAAARSVARIGTARMLCLAIGGWLPLVLVLAAAPSLLRRGVSPAHLIGAIAYLGGALRSVLYTLSQGLGAGMVRLTVTLERILSASAVPEAGPALQAGSALQAGPGRPGWPALPDAAGELHLRAVWFGYGSGAGEALIRDLNMRIEAGDHLAIVGPSGAGKSSLACLLAGLLTPDRGEVLLDGVPVTRYPAHTLPRRRVLIPQEAYVFGGTLAENLCYLRGGPAAVPTVELDAAALAVGLLPLAERPGGYDAVLNPASLSAGERQLIALTRAYLSQASVVILDEATCHLDPAAEAVAEAAFAARPGTLIVIAHRISSALRARRVLVLDGARAQLGDHASLLASSQMYQDLVGYWTATRVDSASSAVTCIK